MSECITGCKDTWCPLGATHQVEARSDDVLRLASSCQVFTDDHLEEVEGRVQTVLVQLQLTTQLLDLTLTWRHTHTPD